MKDTTSPSESRSSKYINAIHKERWVSIAVRYDEFSSFIMSFIIPFKKHLLDKSLITYFYHRMGSNNNVIQLNFVTSPFSLQREIKPFLINRLNSYFGEEYLQLNCGISNIDMTMCEHKLGLDGIDLQNLKLFSTEDLYTSPITYSIGVQGGKSLSELLSFSSEILLYEVFSNDHFIQSQDCIEKSMSFNLIFLYYFIPDKNSRSEFFSWVCDSMLNQMDKSPSNILTELEMSYLGQREQLVAYVDYFEDILSCADIFEDDWMNAWNEACCRYKKILDELSNSGKLTMPYDVKDNPTIRFAIDNKTYQSWQIAYFIVSSINGQMGIEFNTELNIMFWLKRAFQELYMND